MRSVLRRASLLPATVVAVLVAVTPAVAAPGSLDRAFGRDGKLVVDLGPRAFVADLAALPGGDVLVAGHTEASDVYTRGGSVFVRRYDWRGRLRSSFGRRGEVRFRPRGELAEVKAMVRQRDGRILLAGQVEGSAAVLRLTRQGRLDRSFAGDGVATLDAGGVDELGVALARQPDGAVVVAGPTTVTVPSATFDRYTNTFVGRLHPDGSLDRGFGSGDGMVVVDTGQRANPVYQLVLYPAGLALLPDGRILVAASNSSAVRDGSSPTLIVLDPAGAAAPLARDPLLGSDEALDNPSIGALVTDRRRGTTYLVGGHLGGAGGDSMVIALGPDLERESSFGGDGVVAPDLGRGRADYASAGLVDPRGRLVITGTDAPTPDFASGSRFLLARFLQNGRLDQRFGREGRVVTPVGREPHANALALLARGRLLAAGNSLGDTSGRDSRIALVAYHYGNGATRRTAEQR